MTAQESLAMDPEANPADLADLAHQKPELQQQIAKNPAAYPGLLEWISSYGTPEGKEAARVRLQGAAGQGVDEQPTAIFTELESPFATETFPTTASDATVIRTPREERSPLQPILAPPVAPPLATPDVGSTEHTPGPAGPPPLPNYGFSSPAPAPSSPHGATRPPLPSAQQPPSRKSSNVGAIIAIVLAAILVVVVTIGAWLLFFRDDSADTSQQDAVDARTAELEAELEEEKAARKQLEENQVSQEKLDGEMAALEEEEETSRGDKVLKNIKKDIALFFALNDDLEETPQLKPKEKDLCDLLGVSNEDEIPSEFSYEPFTLLKKRKEVP